VDVAQGIRVALRETQHLTLRTSSTAFPRIWNIPYARNPVFTGREEVLTQLAKVLKTGEPAAISQPQAISGLGGIGKTQIAVEYAYRHRQEYQAVLWTPADTNKALVSGYVAIAELLHLPLQDEQDQAIIVQAVMGWLAKQTKWLLILDNADDLSVARGFLPPVFGGHLVLTTRAQTMGKLAQRIQIETMEHDAGALLMLRRAGLLGPDVPLEQATASDRALARAISEELGGLPLALDQAGAYIEETDCSLAAYQRLFRPRRAKMLGVRGGLVNDHLDPVATTWSLSFEKVEQRSAVAADLLRVCAFLAPDGIPEEMLIAGASHLGEHLHSLSEDSGALDEAIGILRAYSLIQREREENTLRVHRLVQAVLRDGMDRPTQHEWVARVVGAVDAAFPRVEHKTWSQCERLLPQALRCAAHIEHEQLTLLEAARLLNQAGYYLGERGRYREAEPLYERALAIREQELGASHPETASSLNNLAALYTKQGKYGQAEPLYERALAICEQVFGSQHPTTQTIQANYTSLLEAMKQSESPDQETAE